MKIKLPQGLQAVQLLKEMEKDKLAKELKSLAAKIHKLEQAEEQLQSYQQEYIKMFLQKANQGLSAQDFQYYQNFIEHMKELLLQQALQKQQSREQLIELTRLWALKHKEVDSLQDLQAKAIKEQKKSKETKRQNQSIWQVKKK